MNNESCIGKRYVTDKNKLQTGLNGKGEFLEVDIKGQPFTVVNTIKTCGFYLSCLTDDGFKFAILPEELNDEFKKISILNLNSDYVI